VPVVAKGVLVAMLYANYWAMNGWLGVYGTWGSTCPIWTFPN